MYLVVLGHELNLKEELMTGLKQLSHLLGPQVAKKPKHDIE